MRRLLLPAVLVAASFFAGMVVTGRIGPAEQAGARQVPPAPTAAPAVRTAGPTGPLPELADVAERVIPSVVNISAVGSRQIRLPFGLVDEQPMQSAGSGVVIRKAGNVGYVLTNAHVVRDLEAYERFIKEKLTRLKGIASIETSFALDQVKRSEALPL